jgi:transposase-like protein
MSTYRIFTTAFKRQVAQEYLAGGSLNALGRKYEVARNLIRIWVAKYQAGECEPDFIPMPRLSAHEVKIAELERMEATVHRVLPSIATTTGTLAISLPCSSIAQTTNP